MMKNAQELRRLKMRLAVFFLATAGLVVGVTASPAGALTSVGSRDATASMYTGGEYVALGDGYTSGQGAPPYRPDLCLRSTYASYPVITSVLSPHRLVANKACSEASIEDVLSQLSGVSASTKLVTITIGAIDSGTTDVLNACIGDVAGPMCNEAVQVNTIRLAAVEPMLVELFQSIAARLPEARIVVLNYPLTFTSLELSGAAQINASIRLLNAVIAESVAAAGSPRVTLTDVTQEFAGHGIGSRIPYIAFNPGDPASQANYYPNALGNSLGYARALATDGVMTR
jgi:lysophospholipase L1-like esterase